MKVIGELKQNTPEWHKFRKGGMGASEANIIMGVSENMSPLMLFNEKVHDIFIDKEALDFIFAKGHRLEAKARPMFEMEMDADFPDVVAVMESNDILRASLDGYNAELNAVWECKYVGQEDFEKVKAGEILDKYFPQLQHQLMVTGAEKNYLYVITEDAELKAAKSKWPYKTAFVEVAVDMDYIGNKLIPALLKFWKLVKAEKEPKISDIDVVDLSKNEDLIFLLEEYAEAKKEAAEWKKKEEDFKKAVYKIAKHTKNSCNGIKITKSKSADKISFDVQGYFDYEKFDVEQLMKDGFSKLTKGKITKRITFPKVETTTEEA